MQWDISKADAYGGILLTRTGQILLREPSNHFDGYLWTFAKGKLGAHETPEIMALRAVEEEMGYIAEVVDVLPGVYKSGLSSTAFFVMRHHGPQQQYDWETQSTRWVSFAEAERMIHQTTNSKGRERDLQVLAAARDWFEQNLTVVLPDGERELLRATKAADWNIKPFPERYITVPLNLELTAEEAAMIRRGFLPEEPEDKWFCYFDNNIFHMHRGGTGDGIFKVYFEQQGKGLMATHADVSRDVAYGGTSERADIALIEELIRYLATPGAHQMSPVPVPDELDQTSESKYIGTHTQNIEPIRTLTGAEGRNKEGKERADELLGEYLVVGSKTLPADSPEFEKLLHELADLEKRRPPLKLADLNIPPGAELIFTRDPDLGCTVGQGNRVHFQGEMLSLSAAALRAFADIGKPRKSARGPDYWLYQGKTLTQWRDEMES